MAREVIEKLVDDLDGGDAAETVSFALDGTSFEIDLSKKNAAAFRKSFDRYVKAGRRSSPASGRRRKAAASTNGSKPKREFDIVQLREWAGANASRCRLGVGSRKPSWTSTSRLAAARGVPASAATAMASAGPGPPPGGLGHEATVLSPR